ncbi:DUF6182 family protein [Streptomyces monashensis]|uniref:Uncharacterized protein n=1 Tax=Streptomyces monashensis TaxID=1678012 RepID=A0A1S2QK98_9ACTN|nr:DUF6182 family protein [Streptomyces monashensis]OIK06021.1 hypothetical protein BIV23_10035 [Streptomyces monashensis]
MTLTQQALREHAALRILAARPRLAARHDLTSHEGLLAAQRDITAEDPTEGTLAVVVLRSFDLARWTRDTCAFALGIDPRQAASWRAGFTRTVFLAGDPAHLCERFSFAHVAPDLSAAWTAPGSAARSAALRRLLKLFNAPAALPARPDVVVDVPGVPRLADRPRVRRALYIATAGCTIAEALVHLNHVLVEAVLDGLIAPGDQLSLRQVPRVIGTPARLAGVRVIADDHDPNRLRAAAGLTEEIPLA